MRTKLVFGLVAVALGSMLALGTATYSSVRTLLRESTLDQLDGLAESKRAALEVILSGWRESVSLVASRTQLRVSLRDHLRQPSLQATTRMRRILEDALESSTTLRDLAVFSPDGSLVARATKDPSTGKEPSVVPGVRDVEYVAARPVPGEPPRVTFASDLSLEGETLGYLVVELAATELADLTGHYDGLGRTGEAMVVMRTNEGPVALHPLRHPWTDDEGISAAGSGADPVERALAGEEGLYWQGVVDYRGVPVWAATRAVPETGWGLVVKVDDSEEREPIAAFRGDLIRLALSFSGFAILIGTVLGLGFAKPIHDLAEVANEIRGGSLSARATVRHEDEVGLLARTFNEMADELEERMTLLNEYRKFFDVSLDMLCIAGTDGFFKRVNPAFQSTLGWSTDELLSRPFFDFVHPEDVEATERVVGTLAQGIPAVSFENRYQCADGTYKRLMWTSYPEPGTGLLYAIAREISTQGRRRA
jgi:PAS domain S-box-containing protein